MLDPCDGTFVTPGACMMVQKHCRLVGCEIDASCDDASMSSVVEVPARQVLIKKTEITGSERVHRAFRIHLNAAKVISVKRCLLVWDSPLGLSPTQTVPLQISVSCRTSLNILLYSKTDTGSQYQSDLQNAVQSFTY